jgi:glycosyltransferase involved in cell wall biosynthesis
MKIIQLNHSDNYGGAARAAYRLHHALRQYDIDSYMWVDNAGTGDWTAKGPQSKWRRDFNKVRPSFGGLLSTLLKTGNPIIHSPSLLSSAWPKMINASDADLIHMHWVNGEMLSIVDISRFKKPVVWTLHDMWAFCGAEHYTEDYRWRDGYTLKNRPEYESGFDLNRWTWNRKRKYWTQPIQIVTPSRWLADCVKSSVLMHDWPVTVVPNAINTDIWQPIDKKLARQLLQLPPDVPLLLFGAWGGTKEPHKGFDLLQDSLNYLRGQLPGLELVVFGQLAPKEPVDFGFPVHYTGHLHDDISLMLLYSAVDVVIIPSRLDNLPNAGVEAHACGTPVVAFGTCGLPDIVHHQYTGYLAQAFDAQDLASGILWVLTDADRLNTLGQAARARAVALWSCSVVAQQYLAVYRQVIDSQQCD